jgi:Fe-S oxidoreductase
MSESSEGGLKAPTRHPLGWRGPAYYDEPSLYAELERVFDICHGCRRCVSLCHAFPTLFDLVDNSSSMEVDGVAKADYGKVVEQCYLCDLCYQTKCPYVPPHPWNVDFPHLMLRAKAQQFKKGEVPASRKLLTNTTAVGKLASIPVITQTVNATNRSPAMRKLLDKTLGVHPQAKVPVYHSKTARKRLAGAAPVGAASVGAASVGAASVGAAHGRDGLATEPQSAGPTRGRVALFVTCYGNFNMPQVVEDLAVVLRHNRIEVKVVEQEQCCGMPKLELGDLESVAKYKAFNLPRLAAAVQEGWDIMAPVPSCVLMFRQEIPLMFPEDAEVAEVKAHIFDPFEYLMHRHKAGLLSTAFAAQLGKVAYHAPCHQRVQNIGPKTRELLSLIPGTEIEAIERCSGHDGTYGVRTATYELSVKLVRPVVKRVEQANAQHISSDCPMAADHIANQLPGREATHPISLLRKAYGV